jgi:hypothetical protein
VCVYIYIYIYIYIYVLSATRALHHEHKRFALVRFLPRVGGGPHARTGVGGSHAAAQVHRRHLLLARRDFQVCDRSRLSSCKPQTCEEANIVVPFKPTLAHTAAARPAGFSCCPRLRLANAPSPSPCRCVRACVRACTRQSVVTYGFWAPSSPLVLSSTSLLHARRATLPSSHTQPPRERTGSGVSVKSAKKEKKTKDAFAVEEEGVFKAPVAFPLATCCSIHASQ